MQVTFTFSNKNDKSDKLLVNNSNYSNNNKLSINDSNYLYITKLLINNDNISNYVGNINMDNNTETSNTISNNNFILLVFSIISQRN